MNEEAKELRRAYYKRWRANNKERIKENNRRYWERKAAKAAKPPAAEQEATNARG